MSLVWYVLCPWVCLCCFIHVLSLRPLFLLKVSFEYVIWEYYVRKFQDVK